MSATPYFVYFGDGKFLPLLNGAMCSHDAHNAPARILTDLTSPIPPELESRTTRVDNSDFLWFVRKGNRGQSFDYKSTIILAFLQEAQPNQFCIMDCDQAFRRSMQPELDKIPEQLMALCPDAAYRLIPISRLISNKYSIASEVQEMTSSLIVFPADARHLGKLYIECLRNTMEPDHFLLEQRTWSVVWYCSLGHQMPKIMNWSRFFGPEPDNSVVRHYHGEEKWKVIKTGQLLRPSRE